MSCMSFVGTLRNCLCRKESSAFLVGFLGLPADFTTLPAGMVFPSAAGVPCHAGRVHGLGVATTVKPLLAGSICQGCRVDFRTRIRLVEHLRPRGGVANDCRRYVLSGAAPRLDPSALAALDEGDPLLRKACREAGISPLASDGFACRVLPA